LRREDVAERVADLPLAEDFELARSVLGPRAARTRKPTALSWT